MTRKRFDDVERISPRAMNRIYEHPETATETEVMFLLDEIEYLNQHISRLQNGEFTEAEAAELIRCVVARQGLTRAQVETACWEWQERTFGPRKTDGTTSLIGTKGDFDGTYPDDKEVVPGGGKESVPGTGGGV